MTCKDCRGPLVRRPSDFAKYDIVICAWCERGVRLVLREKP